MIFTTITDQGLGYILTPKNHLCRQYFFDNKQLKKIFLGDQLAPRVGLVGHLHGASWSGQFISILFKNSYPQLGFMVSDIIQNIKPDHICPLKPYLNILNNIFCLCSVCQNVTLIMEFYSVHPFSINGQTSDQTWCLLPWGDSITHPIPYINKGPLT